MQLSNLFTVHYTKYFRNNSLVLVHILLSISQNVSLKHCKLRCEVREFVAKFDSWRISEFASRFLFPVFLNSCDWPVNSMKTLKCLVYTNKLANSKVNFS